MDKLAHMRTSWSNALIFSVSNLLIALVLGMTTVLVHMMMMCTRTRGADSTRSLSLHPTMDMLAYTLTSLSSAPLRSAPSLLTVLELGAAMMLATMMR